MRKRKQPPKAPKGSDAQFKADMDAAGIPWAIDKGVPFVHVTDREIVQRRTQVPLSHFKEAESEMYCVYPV